METRRGNSAPASLQYAIDVAPLEQNMNQSDASAGSGASSSRSQQIVNSDTSTPSDSSSPSVENMNMIEWLPSVDLLSERRDKHQLLLDLRKAALEGDVADDIMGLMRNNRKFLGAAITEEHETVFHIAAGAKQTHFVEKMIKLIGEEQKDYLKFQNKQCNTAFCFAAMAGSKEIAQAMLNEDESLLTIRGGKGMTPLYLATLFAQRETALFLYYEMKKQSEAQEQLNQQRKAIFYASVDSTLYDLALELLEDDQENELAGAYYTVNESTMTALLRLAQTPLHLLDQTIKSEETGLSNQALKLVKNLWEKILKKEGEKVWDYFLSNKNVLFVAAHLGNYKFLAELIRLYPDLVHLLDEEKRTIFHIAIMHRHANLFNLIYEIGFNKKLVASYKDKYGNSILHLAAKYPDARQVSSVPGAAFEMQQELKIFKEVELLVQPSHREMKNGNHQTPRELFTTEHANLLKKGEEWMRNTATQCMLVATIIATVVFTANFSVPGGNNDKEGIPIHWRNVVFRIFAVAEAMALSFSSISILTFLSILTSRYVENDFLTSLPLKLVQGLLTLCISIATMMLAFISSFFLAYNHHRSYCIPIISTVLVSLPVFVFCYSQKDILRDVLYLLFRFKFSKKPGKGWKTQIKLY